jgi:hypothetical protein
MSSPPNRRFDFDRRVEKAALIARELKAQRLLKGSGLRRAKPLVDERAMPYAKLVDAREAADDFVAR